MQKEEKGNAHWAVEVRSLQRDICVESQKQKPLQKFQKCQGSTQGRDS